MRLRDASLEARHDRSASDGGGFSLVEILVALVLGLFVAHLGLTALARTEATRARLVVRTDMLIGARVARHVLRRELRHGRAGTDWAVDADSLWLRAFRGAATVCANDSASASLVVSWVGDRSPDPAKDSLVLFDALGRSEVRALVGTEVAPACAGPGTAALWVLDRSAPPGAAVAKLFEHGSYHLSAAALRYRRGAAGRQPLTPEVWASTSGWDPGAERLAVEVVPLDTAAGPPWRGFLTWSRPR